MKIKSKKQKADSELSNLRAEKQRRERALERLTNLYLYSEDAMSQREYIVQKAKFIESLDEVTEQIGFASSDAWQESIMDEDFVQRAREFIIARNLTDRSYHLSTEKIAQGSVSCFFWHTEPWARIIPKP